VIIIELEELTGEKSAGWKKQASVVRVDCDDKAPSHGHIVFVSSLKKIMRIHILVSIISIEKIHPKVNFNKNLALWLQLQQKVKTLKNSRCDCPSSKIDSTKSSRY
jgi:hypothetical protein